MNSLENKAPLKLRDGREIQLLDDDEISISIISKEKTASTFLIPYPSAGYGGGAIHLSPSESILLFTYYSGQSEEAFILFTLQDRLEKLFESGYLYGEAASYCFSKDEKELIQCLPNICSEWWLPWEDEDTEEDEDGIVFFDFGCINILKIKESKLEKHIIRIYPTENWEPQNKSNYDPFLSPEYVSPDALKISMPWGEEILKFPFPGIIIFKPK